MKRLIAYVAIIMSLTAPLMGPRLVYAVDSLEQICNNPRAVEKPKVCEDNSSGSSVNPIYGPSGVLTKVINIMALIFGVISVFVIVISGLRMVLSAGDSNSVATARRSLLYAVVALLVALSARILVVFVLSKLD